MYTLCTFSCIHFVCITSVRDSIFNRSDLIHHDKTETKSLSNKSKLRKVFNF